MRLNDILTEEVLEELNVRRGLAAGALAVSLAAAPHTAKADTFLTQQDRNGAQSTMHINDVNSPEYNQKMFPVYQQMLKDYVTAHPGMDISFARDIVRGRWIAKYRSAPPSNQPSQPTIARVKPAQQSFRTAMGY